MTGWRYFATRLNGDGTEDLLADDLPLQDVEVIDDLSGPGGLTATISPEVLALIGEDGLPVFRSWSTALYAEKDGQIRGGGILVSMEVEGPTLHLDAVGFTGYAKDMPYTGDYSQIQVDPLDVARHIWAHLQGAPGGNLGLDVDATTSPVRIGTPEKTTEFTTGSGQDVSFESGPYKLSWWETDDLGDAFDKLAAETPFDYRVEHYWEPGEVIRHRLVLGYPMLGRRRHDLRFAVGENVVAVPGVGFGDDEYADEVVVLGSGEGRKMVRGIWAKPRTATSRLRRVAVVESKGTRSVTTARRLAEQEVRHRDPEATIADEVEVFDHPNAPIGAFSVGDEILVQTPEGWTGALRSWHRILSMTITPENNIVTLTIARAE